MTDMQPSAELRIKGLQNYRLNSTVADSITDEDVAAALTEMPEGLAASVKEAMKELLDSEYDWADAAWRITPQITV